MLVKFFCTKCGNKIESDDSRESIFCMRCGSRETVPRRGFAQQTAAPAQPAAPAQTAAPVQPAPKEPNLVVSYMSINPSVTMILEIPAITQSFMFQSGYRGAYSLVPGQHRIVLQIGRKRYARNVFLSSQGQPVIVDASWDGRARIDVKQPFITVPGYPAPEPVPYQQGAQQYPQQPVEPSYAQQPVQPEPSAPTTRLAPPAEEAAALPAPAKEPDAPTTSLAPPPAAPEPAAAIDDETF